MLVGGGGSTGCTVAVGCGGGAAGCVCCCGVHDAIADANARKAERSICIPSGYYRVEMRALGLVLVATIAVTFARPAFAIPNCPPGFTVAPAYDSKGNPVPGGDCVPVGGSATAAPSPAPPPAPSSSAPKATPRTDKPPQNPSSGCAYGARSEDAWLFVLMGSALALRRRR
jgi:hypothetical protein